MPFFMGHALFEVGKTGVFYCSQLCYNYEIADNIMKILFSPNFKVIMYLFVFKFYPHGMRIRVYTQSFYSVAPCAFTSHDLLLQIFYNAFKFHLHSYANTYQLNRHYPIVFFLIINTSKIQF